MNKPFLRDETINFMTETLSGSMFEYGSGNSTLYFSKYVDRVISVEHNIKWYRKLNKEIIRSKIDNIELNYIPPDGIIDKKSSFNDPSSYISKSTGYRRRVFKNYVTFIDKYIDGVFDWVTVDGRARPSCILHSIPKVKVGGYLFIHDYGRERYQKAISLLKDDVWKKVFVHENLATVWQKKFL